MRNKISLGIRIFVKNQSMLSIQSFTFNPFSENTYVVYNEHRNGFIIDPGNMQDSETRTLERFISDNQLNIRNILLTHAHIDHVLGLQWAFDQYQVPVLLHEIEQEILDRNPMSAQRFGFSMPPFEGNTEFVSEHQILKLDNDELIVYHVPGHSPGHVAFHCKAQKVIISGDVLFQGSIGRTDLYKGNHEQLLTSIREKLFILDDDTEVFSGHGNPTTIGVEKNFNPFFK